MGFGGCIWRGGRLLRTATSSVALSWCLFTQRAACYSHVLRIGSSDERGFFLSCDTSSGRFCFVSGEQLLVSTALIVLSERLGPWMTICSVIILCRELGVSSKQQHLDVHALTYSCRWYWVFVHVSPISFSWS